MAVFVSAEGASCAMCADEFTEQARNLSAALERRGAQLLDAVVVDHIEAGDAGDVSTTAARAVSSMTRLSRRRLRRR